MERLQRNMIIIYLIAYFTYSLAKPEISLKKTHRLHLIPALKITKDNLQDLARRFLPPILVIPKPNQILNPEKEATSKTVSRESNNKIETTTESYADIETTTYNLEDYYTYTTESDISTTDTVTTEDYEDIEFRLSLPSEAIASLVG